MSEVIPADAPPEKRSCSRRKFGELEDIALLKEVLACGAHTCRRGSQMDKFDEVSLSLNSNGALPWSTDGKHCLDRHKLLVASFKRTDRARASASGIEEPFGEKEELLADISSAVDDANERHRAERSQAAVRDTELLRAGEAIRFQAMNRRGRSICSASDGVDGDVDESRSMEENLAQRDMADAIDVGSGIAPNLSTSKKRKASEEFEETLAFSEMKRAEYDELRIKLDRDRLEFERERALKQDEMEEKRIDISSSQTELQRQLQRDNTTMQLKMMSVMEEMLRKLER